MQSFSSHGYVFIAWTITGKIDWAAGIARIEISIKRSYIIGTNVFVTNILNLE